MDIQIPTKLRRNAPCPCGSGKKYKKCCEKKEQKMEEEKQQSIVTPHSLKNEFRDEIRDPYAGIPEGELVNRDQAVLLKELRFNRDVYNSNRESLEKVLVNVKVLRTELLAMPKSPYREIVIESLKQIIENNQNQLKAIELPRCREITLLALEEIFGQEAKELAKPFGPMISPKVTEEDDATEDELTIPQAGDGVEQDDNPREVI